MNRYLIVYLNQTADIVCQLETLAHSMNEAILKLRQKRIMFQIITITVS